MSSKSPTLTTVPEQREPRTTGSATNNQPTPTGALPVHEEEEEEEGLPETVLSIVTHEERVVPVTSVPLEAAVPSQPHAANPLSEANLNTSIRDESVWLPQYDDSTMIMRQWQDPGWFLLHL